jgi:hypothetical protein
MRYHLQILLSTAVLILASVTPALADAYTPLRLYTEVGVQAHAGGAGPLGQLTARFRFADHWYIDAVGKSGAVFDGLSSDDQLFLGLAVGPGWSSGEDRLGWELRVSPRLTHIHHASFASWSDTPGSNLAGDSNGGVSHRSGAELAVGVSGPELFRLGDSGVLWSVDVLGNYLPSSEPMEFGAGVVFGLSLTSRR